MEKIINNEEVLSSNVILLENKRPDGLIGHIIEDDGFVDIPGRVNMAFNVEDFGTQSTMYAFIKEVILVIRKLQVN